MATATKLRRRRGGSDRNSGDESGNEPLKRKSVPSSPTPNEVDPNSKLRRRNTNNDLSVNITVFDVILCALLVGIGGIVRFYGLTYPQAVIFDEVHYLKFIRWTLRGEFFFDVNPVFGKLALAVIARLLNFDINLPDYETPGQQLPSAAVTFAARAPAAVFGALTIPVFYRVCRLLRLSPYAAFVGACFILFDSMHVIQSRIAMVDSVLVYFTCVSMAFALMMWNAKNVATLKGPKVAFRDIANLAGTLVLTGITSGLAFSTRWTAFATPVLIAIVSLFGVSPFCCEPLNALECAILLGSMCFSYFASFAVYFWTVGKTGTGDAFMSELFRTCLTGSQANLLEGGTCKMTVWKRFRELNETIFRYSKGIRGKDKWGSSWFLWIFNYRGALYFREDMPDNKSSIIYVLMNPAMNLLINAFIGLFVVVLFYNIRYRTKMSISEPFRNHLRRGCVLFFGWIGSMAPTMVVYRSGPVYQYLPGLFFAQALAACGFDLIPPKGRPVAATICIATMVAAFVYWSPWVYATPLAQAAHEARRWLPRWD